jgi:aminopeptidase C
VVATYVLDINYWTWIATHLRKHKRYILRSADLDKVKPAGKEVGHAVVIIGAKKDYFYIKNSWGKGFGTGGYFRISADIVPTGLFDVKGEFDDEIR